MDLPPCVRRKEAKREAFRYGEETPPDLLDGAAGAWTGEKTRQIATTSEAQSSEEPDGSTAARPWSPYGASSDDGLEVDGAPWARFSLTFSIRRGGASGRGGLSPGRRRVGRHPRELETSLTATVVGVMDRESWTARTDNIVVVDATRRRLVWIPRDLWSEVVGDRINVAYARGGHELLKAAVQDHGLPAESGLVLLRSGVERAVADLSVTVPVKRTQRYWYPLDPTSQLQDGRKLVRFDRPRETLSGERIHQWLGARQGADAHASAFPDLDRIERQQVLVRRLLADGFAFANALEDPGRVSVSGAHALRDLGAVRAGWSFETFGPVRNATIDGKRILLPGQRVLSARRRLLRRAGR